MSGRAVRWGHDRVCARPREECSRGLVPFGGRARSACAGDAEVAIVQVRDHPVVGIEAAQDLVRLPGPGRPAGVEVIEQLPLFVGQLVGAEAKGFGDLGAVDACVGAHGNRCSLHSAASPEG